MAKKPFFCDDCGTRNTPDSKYCKECGAQIHVAYQTLALSDHDRVDDAVQQDRLAQFLDMAFWHTEAGNTDAALRACDAALAINPDSTTAHSLLGSLYEKKGEDALAIEHFERVLALNPDSEADRAKLAQLREGVHAPPVRPSPVYRWLPPVFATARFSSLAEKIGDRVAELRRPELTVLPTRPTPALAACAAAILVLAAGLFMIKPSPQAGAAASSASLHPSGVNRSAFGGASGPGPGTAPYSMPAPVVLMPPQSGASLLSPPPSVAARAPRPDPFYQTSSLGRPAVPDVPSAGGRRATRASHGRASGRGGLHALPPLSLVAVPSADRGPLAPAPVTVPASIQASSSPYANVPQHTVVVQRLNGTPSEFRTAGNRPTEADNTNNSPPASPPHIEITIDRGSDDGNSGGGSAVDNSPAGETFQQTAFALQQQGDYSHARVTYEKAVHAYQAQIASGRDPEAARRGLEACQTGLQICRQGQ